MSEPAPPRPGPLHVRKYANRRYYDSTRKCNVTLAELHDLVADGYDLVVTDAQTGEEITNVILTHILLEHHAPKLAFFPAAVLHQMIRTQSRFLGGIMDSFFRQAVETQRAAQESWAQVMRSAFGGGPPPASPSAGGAEPSPAAETESPAQAPSAARSTGESETELDDLRAQLAALSRQIEALRKSSE